ncbi:MAG: UTP--glucose-1-phosphate uridylyltransferase [Planctomycetota bacterium]|nr:UTP--glucose-1-phosphate uridylyltransferase [Planctomycetota bacterium]
MAIRKAVIAIAGFGTRFLPATKVVPKELMPIVDKPVVQYLVEEAVGAGITDICLVTRPGNTAVAEHFARSPELEAQLAESKNTDRLQMIRAISEMARFTFVPQGNHLPYGNGSPLLAAKEFIGQDDAFVFMFGDDMVVSDTPCVKQLVDLYEARNPGAVIAAQSVPKSETSRYGIVKLKPGSEPPEMESIIEKPNPDQAPSTLAQFGRFVLSGRILEILEGLDLGKDNELWLTDAIDKLSKESRVLVKEIEGTWYTIGDPLRFLIASIQFALRDPSISNQVADYLRQTRSTL